MEQRTIITEFELRDLESEDKPTKIAGYGALFNTVSETLAKTKVGKRTIEVREQIAPGAFDDVMKDDVLALFNHDDNIVLGRTTSGTLELRIDGKGLAYEVTPPDSQYVRDVVITPMKRKDIRQSSFGFQIAEGGDKFEEKDGIVMRTINKFSQLRDVSPVVYPAYPDTESLVRSLSAMLDDDTELPDEMKITNAEKQELEELRAKCQRLQEALDFYNRIGIAS